MEVQTDNTDSRTTRRRDQYVDPTAGRTAIAPSTESPPRRVADAAPLGLAAVALTTFVVSVFNAHLMGSGGEPVAYGLALAYGGLAQVLAGMWEFRSGNTFGGVAFTSFGGFWLSFWAYVQFYASQVPAADAGHALGLYLIAWGIFSAYMFVASLRTTGVVAALLAALTVTFVLLGVGHAGAHPDIIRIGGWTGLVAAAVAAYASFAGVANATFGRTVLPVAPLTR